MGFSRHSALRAIVVGLMLLSTTGVPLSWHVCSMSGTVAVASKCDMHANGMDKTMCCAAKASPSRESLRAVACCIDIDQSTRVDDTYTQSSLRVLLDVETLPLPVHTAAVLPMTSYRCVAVDLPPPDNLPAWLSTGTFLS